MRKCTWCEWQTDGKDPAAELAQWADHSVEHNPSPAAWSEAYGRIQRAKDKAKRVSE